MNNKSISFMHMKFPNGGAEVVTAHIYNYLISKGYRVFIFSIELDSENLANIDDRINYIKLPDEDFCSLTNCELIIKTIRREEIRFFTTFTSEIPYFNYIKSETGCKIIYTDHGMPFWRYRLKINNTLNQRSFLKRLEAHLLKVPKYKYLSTLKKSNYRLCSRLYDSVDGYSVLCDSYGKQIAKSLNIDYNKSKIFTLTNPTIVPRENINLNKKKQVVFIGRLSCEKRIDILLEIWGMVHNKFPEWDMLIIGDGNEDNNLLKLSVKLKLKNIKFLGYKRDVTDYLQQASILTLTSSIEGWGLVLTEAQTYGVIPIAFNCSAGVKEILSPSGVNGILINNFNIKKYTRELSKLMSDSDYRDKIQSNIIRNSKKHSLENSGKMWIKMLDSLH